MLKNEFYEITVKYLKKFHDITGLELDYWIDEINLHGQFGDYFIGFNLIRFIVDRDIMPNYFFDWYNFVTEYEFKTYSFEEYYKERSIYQQKNLEGFDLHKFEKLILWQMIK